MEFQDVVRKRKMVRSFEDRPIPHEIVERIVANAQRAPSAGFSQGWGFLVLEGKQETGRYWDELWPEDRRADWGWRDLFNAPLLVLLTAVDAGLGAVFFGVFDQAKLRETFGIPDEYTAVGVVAVGYAKPKDRPSPSLKRGHRAAADVVRRGRWS